MAVVGPDIAVLPLAIVKQAENNIPALTDNVLAKMTTKIRSSFNLCKEDDVRKYVARREIQSAKEDAKSYTKAAKIQRLVTPLRLLRRCHLHSHKRRRNEHQREQKIEFEALLSKRVAEKKAKVAAFKAHTRPLPKRLPGLLSDYICLVYPVLTYLPLPQYILHFIS
ncbi:hypothetical protein H0H87_010096 [Tephrocybe sp. NHM501043]|nr:hypothetical protein H0H87_010096 [Tephrocybe sp. NHM501043]